MTTFDDVTEENAIIEYLEALDQERQIHCLF